MVSAKIKGIIMTVLAAVGGILVGVGVVSADDWAAVAQSVETLIGALGIVAAGILALIAKIKGGDAA